MVIVFTVLICVIVGLAAVVLVLLHNNNKPQWQQQPASNSMLALPPGMSGKKNSCCHDVPCSAKCAQRAFAQQIAGAVDGARGGEGLRELIRILDYVSPEDLRRILQVETSSPGALQRLAHAQAADALETGTPAARGGAKGSSAA